MSKLVSAALAELDLSDESPVLGVVFDAGGKILEANAHVRELAGRELVGLTLDDLVVEFERGRSPAALAAEGAHAVRLNLRTFTGLPQTYRCGFVALEGRVVMVGSTELREQEELRRELVILNQELAEKGRELQRSNIELTRLGALKDLFLGMAAHDLRAPIALVKSYGEFIHDDLDATLSPEHREYLDAIRSATELMRSLVDSFLDVALIQSGKLTVDKKPNQLTSIVRRAMLLVRAGARRKGVLVSLEPSGQPPPFYFDGPKIQQAIINLVNNAIQRSPQDGEVLVTVGSRGDSALLTVRDRGAGTPPEIQRDLFTAYALDASTKSAEERSVLLGLLITRLVVEAHGGRVAAKSEPGQGTEITLQLPLDTR